MYIKDEDFSLKKKTLIYFKQRLFVRSLLVVAIKEHTVFKLKNDKKNKHKRQKRKERKLFIYNKRNNEIEKRKP